MKAGPLLLGVAGLGGLFWFLRGRPNAVLRGDWCAGMTLGRCEVRAKTADDAAEQMRARLPAFRPETNLRRADVGSDDQQTWIGTTPGGETVEVFYVWKES